MAWDMGIGWIKAVRPWRKDIWDPLQTSAGGSWSTRATGCWYHVSVESSLACIRCTE